MYWTRHRAIRRVKVIRIITFFAEEEIPDALLLSCRVSDAKAPLNTRLA